jgi:hypothetical protein
MTANRVLLAAMFVGAIAAAIGALAEDKRMVHQMMPRAVPLPVEGELPSLGGAKG